MESSSWLSLSDIAKLKVDNYWRKNNNLAKSKKMASFRGNQPHVTPHSLIEWAAAAYGWPATAAQKDSKSWQQNVLPMTILESPRLHHLPG